MSSREEKKYQCTECLYTTGIKGSFIVHGRRHIGVKPFQCDQCGYASALKGDLTKHQRTHSGEKPYKCDQCCYASTQSNNVNKHVKTHTREKPFKFDQCCYETLRMGSILKHQLTHSEDKQFKFTHRNYARAHSNNLIGHVRRYKEEKPFKCTMSGYEWSCCDKSLSSHDKPTSSQPGQLDIHCRQTGVESSLEHFQRLTNEQIKCVTDQPDSIYVAKDEPVESDNDATGYFTADVSSIEKDTVCYVVDPVPFLSVANVEELENHPFADNGEAGSDEWDTPIKTLFRAEYERL